MTNIALPPLPSMIPDGTPLAHAVREYARQAVFAAQDNPADVCQGCKGAGGTMTGGPCAECYGQGSYEAAREFVRSQGVEHDKRCSAALNLSDPCNCGSDDKALKASSVSVEASIAWQAGAFNPLRPKNAVMVEGRSWYRDDHPRVQCKPMP